MISSVQYLRGIAALVVVLCHASQSLITRFLPTETNFFFWGSAGVDLFFIISGFIMVYITYDKNIDIKDFLLKRVIRIYPVFWFYATIALILFLINPDMINRSAEYPTLILPSYLLIPYTEFTNLDPVAWTLVYELHFYLIFALSLILSNKYRYIVAGLVISIAALSSVFNYESYYLKYITNPIILEFLLGMIVYFIIFKREDRLTFFILSILLISSILFLLSNEYLPDRVLYYGVPAFALMLIALYMDTIKLIEKDNSKISKILMSLGDSSYSLYLSHLFCIGAGVLVFNKLNIINNSTGHFLVFSLAIGSILWGVISYKFIETPLINKLNKLLFKSKKRKAQSNVLTPKTRTKI